MEEYKIISKDDLENLIRDRIKLRCLEFSKVSNWNKYEEAMNDYKDMINNVAGSLTDMYQDYKFSNIKVMKTK